MSGTAKGIFIGNVFLIICCAFYLLWWIMAFKPVNPVKGIRSGWLLIPAFIAGVTGGVFAVRGIINAGPVEALCPSRSILIGAVIIYAVLSAGTRVFFKRPVTTELILIVAWTALLISEANTIYGLGIYSLKLAVAFIAGFIVIALVSLIAYLVYYKLDNAAGFIDGMLPLILAAAGTAAINAGLLTA